LGSLENSGCEFIEISIFLKIMLDEILINEMKAVFGKDAKRIDHALKVMHYAKLLLKEELGGNPEVVIPAAILHDIGIHEAERKYRSSAGPYQEKEGPPIAYRILIKLKISDAVIEEVCIIIANHHSPKKVNTINFKILYDADWLVNLSDEYDCQDKEKLPKIIDKIFLTKSGKKIAKRIYLDGKF